MIYLYISELHLNIGECKMRDMRFGTNVNNPFSKFDSL